MTRAELEKLPVTKLRDLALEKYKEITGVHGMKKDGLVEAIIAQAVQLGHMEKEAGVEARRSADVSQFKVQVRALKAERDRILGAKDAVRLKGVRNEIKRVKRRLRAMRGAS